MTSSSNFAVALSEATDARDAAREVTAAVRTALGGRDATLAVLFVTPSLCTDPWTLRDDIITGVGAQHLIGCTTETVIGNGRELEGQSGMSLWCGVLPDVTATVFHLSRSDDTDPIIGWPDNGDLAGSPLIMVADPFTFPADVMLAEYNRGGLPPIVGGLASGGTRPGEHVLFCDHDVCFDGAVAVALPGASFIPVVSQGCAPIGPDMVITAGGGPVIAELAGTVAFDKIHSVVDDLDEGERRLVSQPLLAGLVIDENKPEYERGDFLVRGIHGRDPDTGAVYVGENVRVGQTFRLHVRDAASASDDLRQSLRRVASIGDTPAPAAGLVFSCNGRGQRLFGSANHDAQMIADEIDVPTAGMFCNGEIGPVGGASFLHAFTATMAVFFDI